MASAAAGQDSPRGFLGAMAGVAALSPDARAVVTADDASVSLYDPKIGAALNVFGGVHATEYFSVQVNWIWNRNDIILVSSSQAGAAFYEQRRRSRQHAAVIDALVYFRRRDSTIRPYLGTGLAVFRFSSDEVLASTERGLPPPAGPIAATHLGLRSHVGIDARLSRNLSFRYSFSETISPNPISPSLAPPAQHRLMNFQNLFGVVASF
jgi:outer membrane protein W